MPMCIETRVCVCVCVTQGLVAEASVSAESLLQAAQSLDLQEVPCDPLSNEDADMALCTGPATPGSRSVGTLTVPLMAGPDQGHVGVGTLVLELQRVRRAVMETEAAAAVAPLASENSGVVTFGALRSDVGMTVIGSTGDQVRATHTHTHTHTHIILPLFAASCARVAEPPLALCSPSAPHTRICTNRSAGMAVRWCVCVCVCVCVCR